jgi:RNA polymerase sigma-70 factor (ECF subfamily)
MKDWTDEKLVESTLEGVHSAYEELIRRHQDSVFNLALHSSRNWHVARDLAQETFVRAFERLKFYRAGHSFRNWVMTICANLAKNHFRAESRRRNHESTYVCEKMMFEEGCDNGYRGGVDLQNLDRALGKLPESLRVPVVLKYVEGLDYASIAGIVNIGVSAAKMRVKRGLAELLRVFVEPGRMVS